MSQPSCFVIAEVGVNHNGDTDMALELVDIAADAGADAVKFQTFSADRLVTPTAEKARYQIENLLDESDQAQYTMLKALELDEAAHVAVAEHAQTRGIEFMSTPFDVESLFFLTRNNFVSRLKLGSGEIGNLPLLWQAGASGLPIVLSTGMATLEEIELSLGAILCGATGQVNPTRADLVRALNYPANRTHKDRLTLLQCTTDYPAQMADMNLRVIPALRETFGVEAGFSDHSSSIVAAIGAVALGATMVEKHFTLSHDLPGPDHKASLEPAELSAFVAAIRDTERALGSPLKAPTPRELQNVAAARKSLVAARPILEGTVIEEADLACLRPGGGTSPLDMFDIVGTRATRSYETFELIRTDA